MGQRNEQNMVLDISLEELEVVANQSIMFEMVQDTDSGDWRMVF